MSRWTRELKEKHLNEWLDSGVHPDIVKANVTSLELPEEIDDYLNRSPGSKWKAWKHGPGWWVDGIDPETETACFAGGQFKPDVPVGGKKYFSPTSEQGQYFNSHPLFLNFMGHCQFEWSEVLGDVAIPFGLTEGAKKAASVTSLYSNLPMVSVASIGNGQKAGRMHPALEKFCKPGRIVYLFPDADWRINKTVMGATKQLGAILKSLDCRPYIVYWEPTAKGIDDWITQDQINAALAA